MKRIVSALISVFLFSNLFAQVFNLTGKVYGVDRTPLVAAYVCNLRTNDVQLTVYNGEYQIKVQVGDQIEYSYVGYQSAYRSVVVKDPHYDVILELEHSDPILVTATTSNTTTSIVSDVAETSMGKDIPFILDQTPSLVATSETGTGLGYTRMRVRGTDISRMNITIDGVPMNDAESQDVYFVNLGDFSSAVSKIELSRGVATSGSGTSSFGASMNFDTKDASEELYGQLSGTIGSFGTRKFSAALGTGLLGNHFMFDMHFGTVHSDGWVQRGKAKLQSFDVAATYKVNSFSALQAKVLYGKQKTGITWEGLPSEKWDSDPTYNSAGCYYDDEGNEKFYGNESDNYTQTRYSLTYNYEKDTMRSGESWTRRTAVNVSLFATKGEGYYEQYKDDAKLKNYGFAPAVHDLIRQKALDNIQYGYVAGVSYKPRKITYSLGNSYSIYDGYHFGQVIWIQDDTITDLSQKYYENYGLKKEMNIFARSKYNNAKLTILGELQYRTINYEMSGDDDDLTEMNHTFNWKFFNPELGLRYRYNKFLFVSSLSMSNREPTRANLKDAAKQTDAPELLPETLYDFELGCTYANARLSFTTNFFTMYYDNQLVQTGKLNDVGDAILENVKTSYRYGVELSFQYRPVKEICWKGNVTLSQNKIRDYVEYATDYDDDWNEIQKVTPLGTTDISYSPNVVASHSIFVYPTEGLSFGLVSKFVGPQYFDNTSNADRKLDKYTVHDFQARYLWQLADPGNTLDFQFAINNILDKMYISNAYGGNWYEQGVENTWKYYFPQAGIHYTLKVTYSF